MKDDRKMQNRTTQKGPIGVFLVSQSRRPLVCAKPRGRGGTGKRDIGDDAVPATAASEARRAQAGAYDHFSFPEHLFIPRACLCTAFCLIPSLLDVNAYVQNANPARPASHKSNIGCENCILHVNTYNKKARF